MPVDSPPEAPASADPGASSRRRLAWVVGTGLAAALLVATLLALSHEDPKLRPAASVSTTTSTAPSMLAPADPSDPSASSTSTTAPSSSAAPPTSAAPLSALPARTSRVATARAGIEEIDVHVTSDGGEVAQTISATGDYGQRQVFLVVGEQDGRLQVVLPVRPNGSRGWIDTATVDVTSHDYQIQVSLSAFQIMVQKGTEVVVDSPIGVGTQDTPTVGGEFYTWVLIDPTNAGYGSYAYGLSGFSTLESFAGGDGRMGIHGTADDSSIGRNVSHGCVRIPDDVVVRLVEDIRLPLGVPVSITG